MIQKLTIVAGPSAVGKSTLIREFTSGKLTPNLNVLFGEEQNYDSAQVHNAMDLDQTRLPDTSHLILHYDIYSNHKTDEGFLYLPQLLQQVKQVSVITLCSSSKTLLRRMRKRLLKAYIKLLLKPSIKKIRKIKYVKSKVSYYNQRLELFELYNLWHRFIEEKQFDEHYIIDTSSEQGVIPHPYDPDLAHSILNKSG